MASTCTLHLTRMGTRSSAHGAVCGRSGTAPCMHLHRAFATSPAPKRALTGRCGPCKDAGGKGTHGSGSDGRNKGCWGPRWPVQRAHRLLRRGMKKRALKEARASAVCGRVEAASGGLAAQPGSMTPTAHALLLSRGSTAAGGPEGGAECKYQFGCGQGGRQSGNNAPSCGQEAPLDCLYDPLDAPAQ